jgi:hypothetical protein
MLRLLHEEFRPSAPASVAPSRVIEYRRAPLWWRVRQMWKLLRDGSYFVPVAAKVAGRFGLAVIYGELRGKVVHHDADGNVIAVTDYGLLGRRVVTSAGVTYLAADMAGGSGDINALKYHGFGTGANAENSSDAALQTELTTEYASNNTRPTGSQSSSTNVYTTIADLSPDANVTITEHGIFDQAANGGGTLWDRTRFTGIALVGGADSLRATYAATFPAGS